LLACGILLVHVSQMDEVEGLGSYVDLVRECNVVIYYLHFYI